MTFSRFQNNPALVLKSIQRIWTCGHLMLCLSATPDNLLMWAHYAQSHEGFVIGFNAEHEFLTCPKRSYWPRKVVYQELRPSVVVSNTEFNPIVAYFTKSKHWEYEDEYRVIRKPEGIMPLGSDQNRFPIYLFDLPASAINEVVVGCRCSSNLILNIEQLRDKQFPHVLIKKAVLSNNEFKMLIAR